MPINSLRTAHLFFVLCIANLIMVLIWDELLHFRRHKKGKHSEKESKKKHKRKNSPQRYTEGDRNMSPFIDVDGNSSSTHSRSLSPKKHKRDKSSRHKSSSKQARHTQDTPDTADTEMGIESERLQRTNHDEDRRNRRISNSSSSMNEQSTSHHHTVFNDNTIHTKDDTASMSVTDDNELLSHAGSSAMDDPLSGGHQNQPEKDKNSSQAAVDIRQQIRSFAREKIATKYSQNNFKKHNRGHKKSHKKEQELLLN